ncbi:MAG: hypothetical protein UV68_C0012G0002 [Candidatus Collierbacteria bacterium GW2011_GWC2_43_12]|uniref:Methyltransferase domain-containing protein n=1 Tax=Candidatus Collierbacteria bacterium GW2011_GWC2_43_12 TaxID=1618390 RepID=A0A0G1G5U6_9BACT|nr:MAG: hypothetical protein UV68_C0012G0002 [Candidatus Collierbacteria bacterium GW2011_GWC2_43_12]
MTDLLIEVESIQKTGERLEDPKYLPSENELIKLFQPDIVGLDWLGFIDEVYKKIGYEIITNEYIEAVTKYLSRRVEEINAENDKRVVILEVGAGTGRLSHFIDESLKSKSQNYDVVSTDLSLDNSQNLRTVEQLGYEEAIEKYHPDIIICSWMPSGQDWTPTFRNNQSTKEYILIGIEGGRTGNENTYKEVEGFTKAELIPEVNQFGLESSPYNLTIGGKVKKSKTYSFRRN